MSRRPVLRLFADAALQFAAILRGEVAVARIELAEKLALARTGLVLVVIAAGFLIAALVLLCRAAIEALIALGLEPAWANLSVAGAALVLALIFGLTGARALRPERLRPERTMRAIKRDAATLHKVFQDEP